MDFLLGISQRRAHFLVRRHGNLTVKPQDEFGPEVETETGWVSERRVWICRNDENMLEARLVRVRLKQPTEDGDLEVQILTNLPAEVASAEKVSLLYLKRWKIEGVFHELTMSLNCEVNTLGYPKAALFGFCVALMAYNVLAVLKAAMRSVHGQEKVEKEVSGYYMALEWATVYMGMMIAIPAPYWEVFGRMQVEELASCLRQWAGKIKMETIKKSSRKPTKQKTEPIKDESPHFSTARFLDEAKKTRAKKTTAKTTPPKKTTAKNQPCYLHSAIWLMRFPANCLTPPNILDGSMRSSQTRRNGDVRHITVKCIRDGERACAMCVKVIGRIGLVNPALDR